jgi:hypothetical protein
MIAIFMTSLYNDICFNVYVTIQSILVFQMMPDPASEVVYNGKTYSVLSHVSPEGTVNTCQDLYLPLDSGYVIAPDDADSIAVITAYPWSTDVVIVASGNGYNGANYAIPGDLYQTSLLSTSGSTYKAVSCSMQILQVIYTRVLSFHYLL